jgi:transcriptional regulator GlxA family with amidase domain
VRYVERSVPQRLQPFVECVWTVSARVSSRAPERIVPDGCPEIIVHLGDVFARHVDARWLGAAARRDLVARLVEARPVQGRLDAAIAWLGRHGKPAPVLALSMSATALIVRARGQIRIDDIAAQLGCTRRQLERSFARDLGLGPKVYARIVRLNTVLARLDESERPAAVDASVAR